MLSHIKKFLEVQNIEYLEDVDLSSLSPIKIGGKADAVAYPNTICKLISLVTYLDFHNIRLKILGRTSNILFVDKKTKPFLISTVRMSLIEISENTVTAQCGALLSTVCARAATSRLSGLEEISGIPGTIGGAVFGNSGAFGKSISDIVKCVTVYDRRAGVVKNMTNKECQFSYRHSGFSESGDIILSVVLLLDGATEEHIGRRSEHFRLKRAESQPCGLPSLGSVFKRPKNGFAGEMIEKCGLKGHTLGGAAISEAHAGFIVNIGGATTQDFIGLYYLARKCVFEKFSVMLEPEIQFV